LTSEAVGEKSDCGAAWTRTAAGAEDLGADAFFRFEPERAKISTGNTLSFESDHQLEFFMYNCQSAGFTYEDFCCKGMMHY
jgi:hypothetical protein